MLAPPVLSSKQRTLVCASVAGVRLSSHALTIGVCATNAFASMLNEVFLNRRRRAYEARLGRGYSRPQQRFRRLSVPRRILVGRLKGDLSNNYRLGRGSR
jgi:hypothetical protein